MMMIELIGIALLVSGGMSLVLNERTVRWRRAIWSWRRDDHDPQRDRWLDDFYGLQVHLASIAYVEIGLYLSGMTAPGLWLRVIVYLALTVGLTRRRPALREGMFWRRFGYHPVFH